MDFRFFCFILFLARFLGDIVCFGEHIATNMRSDEDDRLYVLYDMVRVPDQRWFVLLADNGRTSMSEVSL